MTLKSKSNSKRKRKSKSNSKRKSKSKSKSKSNCPTHAKRRLEWGTLQHTSESYLWNISLIFPRLKNTSSVGGGAFLFALRWIGH
jgi:hypothetical protein